MRLFGKSYAVTFDFQNSCFAVGAAAGPTQRCETSGGRMLFGVRLCLLLALLSIGPCAVAANAAASRDFAGVVDIGGDRKMYLTCRGAGFPTVVLVAGQRGSAEEWSVTEKSTAAVFPEVAKFTRVCAYDRPGTPVGDAQSRSDPASQPTTARDAVADLHALLTAAGEVGAAVLVGHSYGGLVVRLHASLYPDEVSGLVLIDALSEWLRELETPQQWVVQRRLIEGDVRESLVLYPALERIDVDRSFDQIRVAPPLRPLPLIVLSADRPWGPQIPSMIAAGKLPADIPPGFGYVTDAAQQQAQDQLAKLAPNAKHIASTDSGHEIQKEQPQLVVDAIREMVEAVHNGNRQQRDVAGRKHEHRVVYLKPYAVGRWYSPARGENGKVRFQRAKRY
jgi:pimeloyl-ACP methyl ester carboxylesterase